MKGAGDALELMSAAWSHHADLLAIPAERLGEEFLRLRSGVAGEFVQKFVTCGMRLVVIGDIPRHINTSAALRDFVYESNKGQHLWFVPDLNQLAARLSLTYGSDCAR